MDTTSETETVLAQLREAGDVRAGANRHSLTGLQRLREAYADIRVYTAEAVRLKLTQQEIADAVKVSRKQLWAITTGKTKV